MAPTSKPASKDRRKSDKPEVSAPDSLVTLRVSPASLRAILEPGASPAVKEDSPAKESPPAADAPASNPENASDSAPNTPAASGTPAPGSAMGPPAEGPKKKGVKRPSAAFNGNGELQAKARGKPGPKSKKPRLCV